MSGTNMSGDTHGEKPRGEQANGGGNRIESLFDRKPTPSALRARYQQSMRREEQRRRDAAQALDTSEAELVDQQCGVDSVRLNQDFAGMLEQMPGLGYIMTLTRNEHAIHERKGVYGNVSINGGGAMALVLADDRKIDLRIILHRWRHGFAVREMVRGVPRHSLQFFDQEGAAIQKIFLQPGEQSGGQPHGQSGGDEDAYARLVARFRAADQDAPLEFSAITGQPETVGDEAVDISRLREDWAALTDVHQFFGLLRKHKVTRQQAFRLTGGGWVCPVVRDVIETMLAEAAEREIPIMCFVGNRGNIQIHSGAVKNIKRIGPWLNVLDPEFNLHLKESGITHAWRVRKPTADGVVTSLEFYDARGDLVTQFFGVRHEGQPENAAWRDLAESLPAAGQKVA